MRSYLLIFLLTTSIVSLAQESEYSLLKSGNDLYKDSSFANAAEEYKKAAEVNSGSFEAAFNLGNAMYRQDSLEAAQEQFQLAANLAKDKEQEAEAYHNLGNTFLKKQDFQKSIDAYKNALRRNPADEDTRYNLAYAKEMLKNQQNQQNQNQDQNKDQNQDQNKDQNQEDQQDGKKDNNSEDQGKDKQDKSGDQKDNEGKEKDEQQKGDKGKDEKAKPEEQKGGMSKKQAEKLLNAMDQDEAELRKSIRLKEEKTEPKYIEKNW